MKIAIRTDASTKIGSGHVMRCLTLAEGLNAKGTEVIFICREHIGNLCDFLVKKNFKVFRLPAPLGHSLNINYNLHSEWLGVPWEEDCNEVLDILKNFANKPDLLIIDHYALDSCWEKKIRPFVKRIMVIDDLANRRHNCDFLLDQNLPGATDQRYNKLVPADCTVLLGPRYALLRQEFIESRKKVSVRDGNIKNIFVFFGGTDFSNETEKTIRAIQKLFPMNLSITVVVGGNNPFRSQIEKLCNQSPGFNYFHQVDNMAEHMAVADLGIGAGGSTTWERCAVGLPSIIISVAENQIPIAVQTDRRKAALYLGHHDKVTSEDIFRTLEKLLAQPETVKRLSANSLEISDAHGTERVVQTLFSQNG
jgi:UDP-2,4-diacetamido-2,4,6-trideoxy-beta-L-altropyranose hydrolase